MTSYLKYGTKNPQNCNFEFHWNMHAMYGMCYVFIHPIANTDAFMF